MNNERASHTGGDSGSAIFERMLERKRAIFRSLRFRILLWQSLILLLVILAFGVSIYVHQRGTKFHEIDGELTAAVQVLLGKLQAADSDVLRRFLDENEPDNVLRGHLEVPDTFARRRYRRLDERPYFVIRNAEQDVVAQSGTARLVPVVVPASHYSPHQPLVRNRGWYREAFGFGPSGATVIVGRQLENDYRNLNELILILCGIGLVVMGLGLGGVWVASGRAVQPIRKISRVAAQLSEKNLGDRIDASEMDAEFEQLSSTLNEAIQRLEHAFAEQVRFTADASHELRTPLAVMRMHQDLALSRERSPEEYKEAIQVCVRATARMTGLVEGLLELARLDGHELCLNKRQFDLGRLVRQVVEDSEVLVRSREISIQVDDLLAHVDADEDRISQVLLNLLANAIAFSPSGSEICVSMRTKDDRVFVSVSDQGPGLSQSDQIRIFDRFYRVEEERSRQSGGSGLGLPICLSILEAHGGGIEVESEPGQGASFQFWLPAASDQSDVT